MKRWPIAIGILAIILAAGYFWKYSAFDGPRTIGEQTRQEEEIKKPEYLMAVVVDNDPGGRPQAGLEKAEAVIETLAEGGVTRFLAFYMTATTTEKIGPVRSARPYFVDWALGEGAILAHSGGSKEALEKIAFSPGMLDANEFYNEKTFWREPRKRGPHNLFTSTELLRQLAEKRKWAAASTTPVFRRADGGILTSGQPLASNISVNFSYPLYNISFIYDPLAKTYERRQSAAPKLTPANVVVLYTESAVIDQNLLTLNLRTTGSGRAVIFTGGGVLQARWKKERIDKPLRLLDADGTSVALAFGQTWITVIDQRGSASWK